jgi:2-methylcitrate dehydratase PrpD
VIIDEWVRNIIESSFEILDAEVVEDAKRRIIDIVGCMIGGANAPGCSMVRDLVKEWGGKQEATILVHGVKAPAHNVAMVNSIMARSFDYGVLIPYIDGKPVIGHISETTIPTAITMAERKNIGGKELITALVLGDDIASRLLKASDKGPPKGWDCTGTVAVFGATAIASKLMELNTHQILNAFGIAINQLAGTMQNVEDGVHSFKLPQGLSARAGIFSAELASKGFTGMKDPLLSREGYFALYSPTYDPEILTKELGRKFYADSTFKPYPSCRCIHPAIDCTLNLVRDYDIKTEDIDEVNLNVTPAHCDSAMGQPFKIGDFPQGNATFNLQYNVANVLLRKSVKLEHFTEPFIRDSKVVDLTKKVNLLATIPSDKMLDASEVRVKLKDGRELVAHVDATKGDPIKKPLTKGEIEEKFRANVAFSKTISKENAEAALDMLNHLEEIDDITKVVQLLVE